MNNEDFERQVAFILEQQARFAANLAEQQARFAANLAKQQERDAELEARFIRVDRQIEQLTGKVAQHDEPDARAERIDRQLEQLVGFAGTFRDALLGLTYHVERHEQQIAEINRGLAELVERGKETDARLNALMLVVERHISGHQQDQ